MFAEAMVAMMVVAVPAADSGGQVRLSPPSGGAGTSVTIYAQCATSGATATVTASSDAFSPSTLTLRPVPGQYWSGSSRVAAGAPRGTRPVRVQCGRDEVLAGSFTVTGGHPTLGPDTGGGWLARSQGPATPPWWLGTGALILAGGALVARSRLKRTAR